MEAPDVEGRDSGQAEEPPTPLLWKEVKYLVLQHLRENGYKETAHSLERETGLYLDAEHLQDLVRRGAWDEAEWYLGGFTGVEEDPCAAQVVFALRKQKYLEALDRRITAEEGEVLMNDLKALAPYDEDVAKMVVMLENYRQRERLDTASARDAVALEIKEFIEANPLFQDKLEFPSFADSRLRMLVNQSLNMQHALCKKQKNPEVKTLYIDHSCDSDITLCMEPEQTTESARKPKQITKSARKPKQVTTKSALKRKQITKPAGVAPPGARVRFADCLSNATPCLPHAVVAEEAPSLFQPPNTAAFLKHPTANTSVWGIDYAMERNCLQQTDEPPIVDVTPSLSCLSTPDVKPKDESEKITTWNPSGGLLQLIYLPDKATPCRKVVSLLYANNGDSLLALCSDAMHKLWQRQHDDTNPGGKLWQPANGVTMKNDTSYGNPEEANACISLSENESYVVSASGGKVSVFNMMTFQVICTFMAPPPAATFIAFHPQDSNIIAFGMEDSTIQIYNSRLGLVTNKLEGHHKKITGLSFSQSKSVLVSSGADAQLCVWSINVWEKMYSRYLIQHPNHSGALDGDTRVQFHNDCEHLLVVNESQLAIYDWKLEFLCLWTPRNERRPRILSGAYSCDGRFVYAGFCDGTVKIFQADLKLLCWIRPSGHVPPISSVGSVYPMVVAAHPSEPTQIALGMSNGTVIILKPKLTDMDEQSEIPPPLDNVAQQTTSAFSNAGTS